MLKYRIISVLIIVVAVALGYFIYATESDGIDGRFDFALGLDLDGGTHLTYEADTSGIDRQDVEQSMSSLRDVIERRVNAFGVSEPSVAIESGAGSERLIVELPGVTDVDQAVEQIGQTPVLEFRLLNSNTEPTIDESEASSGTTSTSTQALDFVSTGLTGRQLEGASLQFENVSGEPIVQLEFNEEGRELFAEITRENIGEVLAIFLDGEPITTPVIRDEIPTGQAIISGNFTPEDARELVRDLKFGALPVPIELVSTQTIGPTLGEAALDAGLEAGIVGLALVAIFLILWYRIPGLLATIALAVYVILMLSFFKLIPVTLTSAGIAGFILSIGMAVDANVLIFERLKEELVEGNNLFKSINEGFRRAWLSIRDGNFSTLITAVILFYATTSLVKGFALVLGMGVIISMFTAIVVTRSLLLSFVKEEKDVSGRLKSMFKSGIKR